MANNNDHDQHSSDPKLLDFCLLIIQLLPTIHAIFPSMGDGFTDASDMVNALANNAVIERVRFEGGGFLLGLPPSGKTKLLTAIGKLPCLQQVHFDGVPVVSVKDLADLLTHARGLAILDAQGAELEGGREDFERFESALSQHRSLKAFGLKDFTVPQKQQDESSSAKPLSFDRILQALGCIPSLEAIRLEAQCAGQAYFSGKALTGLVTNSEVLQQLHTAYLCLDQLSVNRVALAVKSIPSLKNLSLVHAGIDDLGASKLANALKYRATSSAPCLYSLDLSYNDIGDKGCAALADGIVGSKKRSVRVVRLEGNKLVGNAGCAAMVNALRRNENLEHLDISVPSNGGNGGKMGGGSSSEVQTKRTAMAA